MEWFSGRIARQRCMSLALVPEPPALSTTTIFAQKVFQIGEHSTLAMTMWGLGNLHSISYRTLIAQFADSLVGLGAQSMGDVAGRWSRFFWSIYTTIKAMKFSHMAPVCGGPVEVAVITTDRRFRWVRHKGFDAAIGDGSIYDVQRHA